MFRILECYREMRLYQYLVDLGHEQIFCRKYKGKSFLIQSKVDGNLETHIYKVPLYAEITELEKPVSLDQDEFDSTNGP